MVTATCHAALAAIQVPKRSSVGAGDSMVGGIVSGLCRGMSLRDALDLGMTAAAATVMTPGNGALPTRGRGPIVDEYAHLSLRISKPQLRGRPHAIPE